LQRVKTRIIARFRSGLASAVRVVAKVVGRKTCGEVIVTNRQPVEKPPISHDDAQQRPLTAAGHAAFDEYFIPLAHADRPIPLRRTVADDGVRPYANGDAFGADIGRGIFSGAQSRVAFAQRFTHVASWRPRIASARPGRRAHTAYSHRRNRAPMFIFREGRVQQ
jgi:hypothetical protein